jgi:sugar-specific transcriptional regulator TrmB
MDIKTLESLGLSNTEAKVYLALLELGSTTANKIAEKCGIHRRTVYDVLETLIEKGLVSFVIEANKKYYQAENPERFLEILKTKEQEFKKILPELLKKRKLNKEAQEVSVYRGIKGLKNALELMLKSKKSIYCFGSSGKFREFVGEVYYEQWLKKVKKKKIKMYIILSENLRNEKYPKNIITKYIQNEYVLPSSTSIFEDKVLILIFISQPLAMLIRSKEVVESYRNYFNLLWKLAKK